MSNCVGMHLGEHFDLLIQGFFLYPTMASLEHVFMSFNRKRSIDFNVLVLTLTF